MAKNERRRNTNKTFKYWWCCLKKNQRVLWQQKKQKKEITEEEKEKCKAFLEGETGIFIIEKLTRDIIELCKLPKAIELRKIWDIITMT